MIWYDLPRIYDVSFSHDMQDELQFIKDVFSKYCRTRKPSLLEPACGTGRLIVPLARAGFNCSGFDINMEALRYLKKNLIVTV